MRGGEVEGADEGRGREGAGVRCGEGGASMVVVLAALHTKMQHKKHKKADLFPREGRDAWLPQVLIVPPRWLI